MFDVGDSLRDALAGARTRLGEAQAAVARANSGKAAGAQLRRRNGADRRGADSLLRRAAKCTY